jgi:hypothetical protein
MRATFDVGQRPTAHDFYKSAADYADMLDRLILPKFGTWRMDAVTSKDVSHWHVQHESTPYQPRAGGLFDSPELGGEAPDARG